MDLQENILVVIDPRDTQAPALERALITAQIRDRKPILHLLFSTDEQSSAVSVSGQWLQDLLSKVDAEDVEYTSEICWSDNWQESILAAAARVEANLVMIPEMPQLDQRGLFSEARWALLRKCECPVLIVREGASPSRKTVLAAVNMQAASDNYQLLNDKILARGQWMAERYGADFHIVNAYSDSMHYPDKGRLLRQLDIDSSKIHIKQGEPEEVIASVADSINADVVVIGTLARQGLKAALRGNTSEKVLKRVRQDVMAIN